MHNVMIAATSMSMFGARDSKSQISASSHIDAAAACLTVALRHMSRLHDHRNCHVLAGALALLLPVFPLVLHPMTTSVNADTQRHASQLQVYCQHKGLHCTKPDLLTHLGNLCILLSCGLRLLPAVTGAAVGISTAGSTATMLTLPSDSPSSIASIGLLPLRTMSSSMFIGLSSASCSVSC